MWDKTLMAVLTVVFFCGAGVALCYSRTDFFTFASGLTLTAFGAVVALVRGDKSEPKIPVDSTKS